MNDMDKGKKIYKVSELNNIVKELLDEEFANVWLEGEISNFKQHTSGHCYFVLKDENARVSAVMFKWQASYLKFLPEDGLKVIARGNVSLFVKGGNYQVVVSHLEPLGEGPLQVAFGQLKRKLEDEGLFDAKFKKKLPLLVQKLAIVTSPTGAAVYDMLTVIERRFPNIRVLIYPVHVQGETAAGEIAEALSDLNKRFSDMDAVIIGRGGGSLEDLWPFNEEVVARAIFNSKLPVISAVGHEVDYSISDFVSDLRAPTPSAAIELVIANKAELDEKLSALSARLISIVKFTVKDYQNRYNRAEESRAFKRPMEFYEKFQQEIDYYLERMSTHANHYMQLKEDHMRSMIGRLNALSPLEVLSRGYGITWKVRDGRILRDSSVVSVGEKIKTKLHKGGIICEVIDTEN